MNFTEILNQILSPGPALFMPVIFFIFVLIIKIIRKDAITWTAGIRAALTIGIAFVAIGVVIAFLVNTITPAFKTLAGIPGINFGSLDLGWAPISAIAWAWQWAFLMFPIQIVINLVMLLTKQTKTLNIDMWNVWNKIITAIFIVFLLKETVTALVLGFIIGGVQVIIELKNADYMYKRIYKLTKLERVTCPHSMTIFNIVVLPLERLLDKISFFKKGNSESGSLVSPKFQKYSWLIENDIIGIMIGIILVVITLPFNGSQWATYIVLPIQIAAALILFPLATKLFSKSIAPISSAVQKIITSSKKQRDLYIGLDWPFLAGNNKMWILSTILIPFSIAYAFLFSLIPGIPMVFPLGGIVNIVLAVSLLITCQGNIRKMIALGIVLTPIYIFFGAWASTAITALAEQAKIPGVSTAIPITWSGFESPVWRFITANSLSLMYNQIPDVPSLIGIIALPIWIIATVFYFWYMRQESLGVESPVKTLIEKNNWKFFKPKPFIKNQNQIIQKILKDQLLN